jgi:hypothetical protein
LKSVNRVRSMPESWATVIPKVNQRPQSRPQKWSLHSSWGIVDVSALLNYSPIQLPCHSSLLLLATYVTGGVGSMALLCTDDGVRLLSEGPLLYATSTRTPIPTMEIHHRRIISLWSESTCVRGSAIPALAGLGPSGLPYKFQKGCRPRTQP